MLLNIHEFCQNLFREVSTFHLVHLAFGGKSGLDKIYVLYQRHDHLKSRKTEKECVYCEVQTESFNAN